MILGVIYLSFICLNVLSVYTSEYETTIIFFSISNFMSYLQLFTIVTNLKQSLFLQHLRSCCHYVGVGVLCRTWISTCFVEPDLLDTNNHQVSI